MVTDRRGIKPGQIPEWRRGAIFWKPLADGREVTVYPLTFGAGRLCVGPLGDQWGYDIAYFYEKAAGAIEAAREWDGESSEHPAGYLKIGAGDDHGIEPDIPRVGGHVRIRQGDRFLIEQREHGENHVRVERRLANGRDIAFEGLEKRDVDDRLFCEVTAIHVDAAGPLHPPARRVPGEECGVNECGGRLRPALYAEAGVADHTKLLHCPICGRNFNRDLGDVVI